MAALHKQHMTMMTIRTIQRGFFLLVLARICIGVPTSTSHQRQLLSRHPFVLLDAVQRGGAGGVSSSSSSSGSTTDRYEGYKLLAAAIQRRLARLDHDQPPSSPPDIDSLVQAFRLLANAQKTFKGLDGAAHEAYQRTHQSEDTTAKVSGRASRRVARTGAVADGLGACELCELVVGTVADNRDDGTTTTAMVNFDSPTGPLASQNRTVLLNETITSTIQKPVRLLVLHDPEYRGDAGIDHGGIQGIFDGNPDRKKSRGRLLVAIGVEDESLKDILDAIAVPPARVPLFQGEKATALVQPVLHDVAGDVLRTMEPILRSHAQTPVAIHLVGHSLGGGIATLAAVVLNGQLPLPRPRRPRGGGAKKTSTPSNNATSTGQNKTTILQGLARGRISVVNLGAPPCMSSNVRADYVTSILHGDDIVGRSSSESLTRLLKRTKNALKKSFLSGQISRMADTFSLAASSLKTSGSGELKVTGKAFLLRPRRLGGVCSIHEIGSQLTGGREALRASVLWQLNDILLSRSLWKHHRLESYIHGLDRVQLKGVDDNDGS